MYVDKQNKNEPMGVIVCKNCFHLKSTQVPTFLEIDAPWEGILGNATGSQLEFGNQHNFDVGGRGLGSEWSHSSLQSQPSQLGCQPDPAPDMQYPVSDSVIEGPYGLK